METLRIGYHSAFRQVVCEVPAYLSGSVWYDESAWGVDAHGETIFREGFRYVPQLQDQGEHNR